MVIHLIRAGMVAGAVLLAIGIPLPRTVSSESATKKEIDAAVKFYDGVRTDPDKQKAYCDVRQAIGMMASDPAKFAVAQQKAMAATKQLGPDFGKAQSLASRLDMASGDAKRYTSARQALDRTCPEPQ
jgi:hypothetical protein